MTETYIRKPYLIQRGELKKAGYDDKKKAWKRVQPQPNMRIHDFVELDYMGSSEFEFGAWHKHTRRLNAKLAGATITSIKIDKKIVYLLATPEEAEAYKPYLLELAADKIRLKEGISFWAVLSGKTGIYDRGDRLWMDIENDVVFGLDLQTLRIYAQAVPLSVQRWDDQRAKAEAEGKDD